MHSIWLLAVVIGPILLALGVAYAMFRNRQETGPGDEERSDQAAKRLREELNAEDRERDRRSPWT